MKKKLLIMTICMALVMCFALAGCGDSSEAEDQTDATDVEATEEGADDGDTLIVVTEATFAPFEFMEDGSEEIQGFDVDMMNAIAEDQGLTIEFMNIEFDSLIPALESKQADIICAGMNKLAGDRAERVDFGDTYYESDLMLLVSADSELTSIDDVTSDMKLASQLGTTGGDYVLQLQEDGTIAEGVVLNQWTECYMQLQNGDVQGVVVDYPVGNAYLASHSDIAKYVGEKFGDHEEMAFAVQKGNTELLEKLNQGLANIKENGTYQELVDKWFS